MSSKDNKRLWEEEAGGVHDFDDNGDSSSTDDFLSESEEEMNFRWLRSDDGGTFDSENNDDDTYDDAFD
jgi:hypothetical protein